VIFGIVDRETDQATHTRLRNGAGVYDVIVIVLGMRH
jgi:hypothetical protein